MDDIHVFFHVKSMTSEIAVYLMTAMIRQKCKYGIFALPGFLCCFNKCLKRLGIMVNLCQGYLRLRTVPVHRGIKICVITKNDAKVIFF